MKRPNIYVAPWLAEFGWQVAMWVPWLRGQIGTAHVKLFCQPTHRWLYRHVTREVIEFEPMPKIVRVDCQHAWTEGGRIDRRGYEQLIKKQIPKLEKGDRIITPCDLTYTWPGNRCPKPIGAVHGDRPAREPKRKHVAVHVRACPEKCPERNWSPRCAQAVVNALLDSGWTVYAIGSQDGAGCPVGAVDTRGIGLGALNGILIGCEFVVGPSSGPLHFANHCGVPVLWWSGNAKDRARYARVWNPWGLPNRMVSESWSPSALAVLDTIRSSTSSRVSGGPGPGGSPGALASPTSRRGSRPNSSPPATSTS